MGTSAYPGALDNFSESSPTYMADPDATGRTHAGRHDDVESAVEQVEETLGVNPQGGSATVAARIAAVEAFDTSHAANLDAHIPSGAQALGAVGALRWDETVGRRCFAWDTNNERWQMIYGDTGWRDVNSLLINGWTGVGSGVRIRRVGLMVTVTVASASGVGASSDHALTLPVGFAQGVIIPMAGFAASSFLAAFVSGDAVTLQTRDGAAYADVTFPTNQPWPATLPGTPVETIPTLLPTDPL